MICEGCSLNLPEIDFVSPDATRRKARDKKRVHCNTCYPAHCRRRQAEYKRRQRKENPEKVRRSYRVWQLKSCYGISIDEFDSMFEAQGNCCAACGSDSPGWAKDWHLDHDHSCCPTTPTCGECNRGILCQPCNLIIGIAKESPERLFALARYVKQI